MSRAGVISMVVGAVLIVVAFAGTAGSWGAETTTSVVRKSAPVTTPSTTPTTAPKTSAATSADAAVVFLADLDRATVHGDITWLLDHLHPAVIARYGAAQCRAYIAKLGGTQTTYAPSGRPTPLQHYRYTSDGETTVLADVVVIPGDRKTAAGTTPALVHLGRVDGSYRWFTDCGTPLK